MKERSSSEKHTIDDLVTVYQGLYPKDSGTLAEVIVLITKLKELTPNNELILSHLKDIEQREIASRFAFLALDVAEGKEDFGKLRNEVSVLSSHDATRVSQSSGVSDNLEELYDEAVHKSGLRWRLKSLNESLGSLRKGDFGFVFARPEAGKTTFLASECTNFAEQLSKQSISTQLLRPTVDGERVSENLESTRSILWFNNEEQGRKVKIRCYQALFGVTSDELFRNIRYYNEEYNNRIGGRIKIIDDASINKGDITSIVRENNPSLILFDQIDNIRGFDADRQDLVFKAIYQFARELAKEYCPVIGICQAGGTGENKKWLNMNDVDSSHTAKQGAADWMLGIGKIDADGYENVRFLNISKNKLIGDDDTISAMRHGKMQCLIDAERARYKEFDDA